MIQFRAERFKKAVVEIIDAQRYEIVPRLKMVETQRVL